jgi:transposase
MTGPRWRASCSWPSTATPKKKLPTELGYGSGITCWRRLRAWQADGVWDQLHHSVLEKLGQEGQLDWSRAYLD